MNISIKYPWLRPLQNVEEFGKLEELAKADGHGVLAPTHVVWKEGEMAGYFSIGAVPLVLTWFSTKKLFARESLGLINVAENQVVLGGGRGVITPVLKTSPFHPIMPSLGYKNGGEYDLFVKEF